MLFTTLPDREDSPKLCPLLKETDLFLLNMKILIFLDNKKEKAEIHPPTTYSIISTIEVLL